jgi:hypothetical protein
MRRFFSYLLAPLGRHAFGPRLSSHAPQRHGGCVLAVIRGHGHDHDGAGVHVSGATLAFGAFCQSVLLIVAQKAVQFHRRDASELSLKREINAPPVVGLDALLRLTSGGMDKFGKLSRLERSFLSPIWMSARVIFGRQSLLAFWTFGHLHGIMLSGKLGKSGWKNQ